MPDTGRLAHPGDALRNPAHARRSRSAASPGAEDTVVKLPVAHRYDSVNAVAIGRAGDRDIIVAGSGDHTVRVWDAVTGAPVGAPLAGHEAYVSAVAIGWAGDRDVIVSGSGDRTVLIRQHCPRRQRR